MDVNLKIRNGLKDFISAKALGPGKHLGKLHRLVRRPVVKQTIVQLKFAIDRWM